jgi:GT2 family glycosyltransferase
VDDGQLDEPADVFAWCGAAVLLRREYLDDVGLLDERLFLYYEDFELAWRGRERGWRYRYVPASVVRHVHSATVGKGSAIHSHLGDRNRLLTLARHDTAADAGRALWRYLGTTASYARRDVVSPLLRGDRPSGEIVGRRVKAFGAALVRMPGMLRSRRADRDR